MATTIPDRAADVPVGALARPSRSWLYALLAAISALPGPRWIAYVAVFLALALIGHLGRWTSGLVPFGEVVGGALIDAAFPPIFLGAIDALDGVARRQLAVLRPALTLDDAAVAAIEWDLTRIPSRWALAAAALGVLIAIASVLGNPIGYGLEASSPPALWVNEFGMDALSTIIVFAFIAHAIQQLRVVARVHREAVKVDVFRLTPLYAFAALTSWTGIFLIGVTVFGTVSLSVVSPGATTFGAVDLATVALLMVVAVACFILPLLGLHDRISNEKDRRRTEAAASVERVLHELHGRISAGDYEPMARLNDALTAATSALATISRISTWPWRPETLRGFLSALGLPVVLWLITQALSRVLTN